eukprot:SAG11_NODE_1014_length_6184_cov_2.581265_1_plen_122_part_00
MHSGYLATVRYGRRYHRVQHDERIPRLVAEFFLRNFFCVFFLQPVSGYEYRSVPVLFIGIYYLCTGKLTLYEAEEVIIRTLPHKFQRKKIEEENIGLRCLTKLFLPVPDHMEYHISYAKIL